MMGFRERSIRYLKADTEQLKKGVKVKQKWLELINTKPYDLVDCPNLSDLVKIIEGAKCCMSVVWVVEPSNMMSCNVTGKKRAGASASCGYSREKRKTGIVWCKARLVILAVVWHRQKPWMNYPLRVDGIWPVAHCEENELVSQPKSEDKNHSGCHQDSSRASQQVWYGRIIRRCD